MLPEGHNGRASLSAGPTSLPATENRSTTGFKGSSLSAATRFSVPALLQPRDRRKIARILAAVPNSFAKPVSARNAFSTDSMHMKRNHRLPHIPRCAPAQGDEQPGPAPATRATSKSPPTTHTGFARSKPDLLRAASTACWQARRHSLRPRPLVDRSLSTAVPQRQTHRPPLEFEPSPRLLSAQPPTIAVAIEFYLSIDQRKIPMRETGRSR